MTKEITLLFFFVFARENTVFFLCLQEKKGHTMTMGQTIFFVKKNDENDTTTYENQYTN